MDLFKEKNYFGSVPRTFSEKIIIYGNRYRSSYEEIDIALTKAEELFKRGKYKESLDLSMKSLSFIDKNVTEKF